MADSNDTSARAAEDDLPLTAEVDEHPPRLASEIAMRLSASEQVAFFCTLVDSAFDAIIAHRPDGSVVWANRGASELLEYTPEELMALPPYGWVAPRHMAGAPRRIEKILREGHLVFDSAVRLKDGTLIDTEVSSRRVDTPLGPVIVAVIRDVSEWVESKRTLQHLAFHDGLTGLANRVYFDDLLARAIADAKRFGDILGIAYLDLDEFKPVNDRFGHDVGDAVLVEVGQRLADTVRVQDTVARIGGDEFVLILPRLSSPQELEVIAARLIDAVQAPIVAVGHTVGITASVGLVRFDPRADTARSVLVKADIAMYAAKKDPNNPWLVYYEGMPVPEGRLDK